MTTSATTLQEHLMSLPEWKDDQRTLSLFSSFRKSYFDENDEASNSKLSFWRSLILYSVPRKWVGNEDIFCFHSRNLPLYFQRKGSSPLGIGYIIKRMYLAKELLQMDDFYNLISQSFKNRVFTTIKRVSVYPLAWTSERIYSVLGIDHHYASESQSDDVQHEYLIISFIKTLSERILKDLNKTDVIESCLSLEEFKSVAEISAASLGWEKPSDRDIDILLQYMKMNTNEVILEHDIENKLMMIIIKANGYKYNIELLDILRSVMKLKMAIVNIDNQLHGIDRQLSKLDETMKDHLVRRKNKAMALECLKRKKYLEASQLKLMEAQNNLEILLLSIKGAKTNQQILSTYKVGVKTLNNILNQKELSAESIDNVMDSLMDAIEKEKEIDLAIVSGNESVNTAMSFNEDEIQEELEKLMSMESKEEKVVEKGLSNMDDLLHELDNIDVPLKMPPKDVANAKTLEELEPAA